MFIFKDHHNVHLELWKKEYVFSLKKKTSSIKDVLYSLPKIETHFFYAFFPVI